MPIYNYKCEKCDHVFEMSKKISERDVVAEDKCPNCSEIGVVTRQVGAPLVAYSVTVAGSYGNSVPSGWRDVLSKIHQKSPQSRINETSSHW